MLTRNRIDLIGNVGANPVIRPTAKGGRIASFSLATHDYWTDKGSGETRKETQWHRIVVFSEPLVERIEKWLRKGHKLALIGSLHLSRWTDKDHVEHSSTEVHIRPFEGEVTFLEPRPRNDNDAGDATGDKSDNVVPVQGQIEGASEQAEEQAEE